MNKKPIQKPKATEDIKVIVENSPTKAESTIISQKLSEYLSKVWKEEKAQKSPQN